MPYKTNCQLSIVHYVLSVRDFWRHLSRAKILICSAFGLLKNYQFLRAFPQEIVPKQFRDFYQQGKVDARLFQHLVGVAAVGMYGGGEPGDRPFLPFQFLPYHISDVNFFHKNVASKFYLLGRPGIPERINKKTHDISRERSSLN